MNHPADAGPAAIAASLRATWDRLRLDGIDPAATFSAAWADALDDAIRALAKPFIETHPTLAVVALGSYSRRHLTPFSDVDLLLGHYGVDQDVQSAFVKTVVYPLWDAGLTVGYAVHSPKTAVAQADHDVKTATALLETRTIIGDKSFGPSVARAVAQRFKARGRQFVTALLDADAQRRQVSGDSAEALEPDLKNGAGGVRDVQSLRWLAAALVGEPRLDALVSAGYLGAPDLPRIVEAERRLVVTRCALHLALASDQPNPVPQRSPRITDVLRMDLQDTAATVRGVTDTADALAPHLLLQSTYLDTRTINHMYSRATPLIAADMRRGFRRRRRPAEQHVDGFELVDGVMRLAEPMVLDAPDFAVRLFVALVATGSVLDRRSAATIRRFTDSIAAGGPNPWRFTYDTRAQFVTALSRGRVILRALAELDDVGVITALMPEWAPLRARPQRNPYHRYALDRHAFYAVAELGELIRNEAWASDVYANVVDRDALWLGTLLHDVGKALGEPHEQTGVGLALVLADRFQVADETKRMIATLVALHLVLPHTSRTRDIADPALARDIAAQVGDTTTLASLQLLAVADGRATGPTAASTWTQELLTRLVRKVYAVLDDRDPDSTVDGAHNTAAVAQQIAPELGCDAAAVREHLAMLPQRYAAAMTPRAIVRHALMTHSRPDAVEVRTRVTAGTDDPDGFVGIDELDVVALDNPGWFAKVAGVVSMHGGSIVAADAFTRSDGIAIETFKVRPPEAAVSSWWARVEGDLDEAASGRLAVRARVLKEAKNRKTALSTPVATTVSATRDSSGANTILEVRTQDRPGVLYSIAQTLAELQVNIVVARIQTPGDEAVDVFTVRNPQGEPCDEHHLGEIEFGICAALELLQDLSA